MTIDELYEKGNEAYNLNNYSDAIKYFEQCGDHIEARAMLALSCYMMACQVSLRASNYAKDNEEMFKGQQQAVKLCDLACRHALNYLKDYPHATGNCDACAMIIVQCNGLHYAITASGLTTAYHVTSTKTTIEKTMMGDTAIWEEITGVETTEGITYFSADMHDYHVFGPDEHTLRIEKNRTIVEQNAAIYATALEYLNRPYDAYILRAEMACQIANCNNGTRKMIMEAEWFVLRALELAAAAMTEEQFNEWKNMHSDTIETYYEYEAKYAALLRGFRREGLGLDFKPFFQNGEALPAANECQSWMETRQIRAEQDSNSNKGQELWQEFLSVFAQTNLMRLIPTLVFSSMNSLFCGGLHHLNLLSGILFIITLIVTFVRSITDSSGVVGKKASRMYTLILLGIAVVFSYNFLFGVIALVALTILSKPYK